MYLASYFSQIRTYLFYILFSDIPSGINELYIVNHERRNSFQSRILELKFYLHY